MPVDSDLLVVPVPQVPFVDPAVTLPGYVELPTNTVIEACKSVLISNKIVFYNSYLSLNDSYKIVLKDPSQMTPQLEDYLRRMGWLGYDGEWSFSGVCKKSRREKTPNQVCMVPPDMCIMA